VSVGRDPHVRHRRVWLFVPGAAERFVRRLSDAGADAAILDLEDGLDPADRPAAHARVASLVAASRPEGPALYVRPAAIDAPSFEADVAAGTGPGTAGFVLPKVSDVDGLRFALDAIDRAWGDWGPPPGVIAMVESARGLLHAAVILAASDRVVGVSLGVEDLCADLGLPPGGDATGRGEAIADARRRLVIAAAAARVAARVDGPSLDLDDVASLEGEAARLRSGGWTGRMVVHPRQVAPTRAGFAPSAAEVAWAEAVLAAPEGGAVRVGSTMVDAPVRAQARRVLEETGRG
jgi:citrate lyase subunit beta/citryl-CoA lyase